jgi:hypothetical protein
MPFYIKNAGTFSILKKAFVKNSGTWSEVKAIWIKNGGVWTNSFVNTIPTNNLLAFWNLNNASSLSTIPSNFGSYTLNKPPNASGAFNTSVQGKINNALNFNGTSQGLWTNEQLWNMTTNRTSFSVSYWWKTTATNANITLMGNAFGPMGFHFDYYGTTGAVPAGTGISFRMNRGVFPYTWNTAYSNEALSVDTWYHIVGTFNVSTSTMKLYVNGILKNTNSSVTFGASPTAYPQPTYTGFALNGSVTKTSPGSGKEYGSNQSFDAVGFWTRDLTIEEITTLYNGGNGIEY